MVISDSLFSAYSHMADAVPAIEDLHVMTYIIIYIYNIIYILYTGQYEADIYNTIVTVSNESVYDMHGSSTITTFFFCS